MKLPCWALANLSSFRQKIGPDAYDQVCHMPASKFDALSCMMTTVHLNVYIWRFFATFIVEYTHDPVHVTA